jgi:hypothetical protein
MKLDQTFDFCGFSTNSAGVRKFRVGRGNLDARVALLTRQGHTDIDFQALGTPLTREQAKLFCGIDQAGITVTTPLSVAQLEKAEADQTPVLV